jgi:tetratricopeptide (TPR) repeat protein
MANALWDERRFDDALRKFSEAVRLAPKDPAVLIGAARALGLRYQIQRSESLLAQALHLAPRRPEVQHAVGETYLMLDRPAKAEACFRRACRLSAEPQSLLVLAKICERRHELDEAADLVAQIRRRSRSPLADARGSPAMLSAQLLQARIERRRGQLDAAHSLLQQLIATGTKTPKVLAEAYGELCALLDAMGQYDAAWAAILQCKQLMLADEVADWNAAQFVLARCRRMVDALTAAHFRRWQSARSEVVPHRLALLTGFPRTGTTLLEQVLDAHPQVVSSEEKEVFSAEIFPQLGSGRDADTPVEQLLDDLTAEQIRDARHGYLSAVEAMLGEPIGPRWHLDKNPAMNLMIPPMRRVFPELKLIVALRDPRDVIVSCFLRYLPINPVSVCFLTLQRTADRFALDMGAWLKFRELLDNWVEVRYEDMVRDWRHEAQRLVAFLDLPWDDTLLGYREHAANRPVQSPTYAEVARPIFTTSVGRWQNYEHHLAPVLETLAPAVKALGYES